MASEHAAILSLSKFACFSSLNCRVPQGHCGKLSRRTFLKFYLLPPCLETTTF